MVFIRNTHLCPVACFSEQAGRLAFVAQHWIRTTARLQVKFFSSSILHPHSLNFTVFTVTSVSVCANAEKKNPTPNQDHSQLRNATLISVPVCHAATDNYHTCESGCWSGLLSARLFGLFFFVFLLCDKNENVKPKLDLKQISSHICCAYQHDYILLRLLKETIKKHKLFKLHTQIFH